MPRFSISSDYKLRNILSQLGIKKVFNHESDLSGITEVNKLGVSEVVHQAMLDVGEEGTEGAAATGIKMVTSTLQAFIASFGRPFLISVIHKDTQSIIFLG
uniref:Serpin domain-containing protein n=1 Tax=Monodon monoceros TaxID=40151 RepID=A0A8C6BU97_MONMO